MLGTYGLYSILHALRTKDAIARHVRFRFHQMRPSSSISRVIPSALVRISIRDRRQKKDASGERRPQSRCARNRVNSARIDRIGGRADSYARMGLTISSVALFAQRRAWATAHFLGEVMLR
jgi:hypothetical protein